jgi:cation/acetate symporter
MALMFGTAGLPHILMRFFTVPDAKEARKSVFWATTWIGYFYVLIFIIGFGAITLVLTNPEFSDVAKGVIKGGAGHGQHGGRAGGQVGRWQRVLRLHLGRGLRDDPGGGAGLTLSGASAVSHDIYATLIKKGKADSAAELKVSRVTTLALGVLAVTLGHRLREAEHRLHGVAGFRHRCLGQLPGPVHVGAVERLHHPRARSSAASWG